MYTITKYTKEQSANLFFVSDTHFNQSCRGWEVPLWSLRGFGTKEECQETIITKWNDTVNDNSIIYHLGDFVFEDPEGVNFLNLLRRLKFSKLFLLTGNHTSGAKFIYQKALFHELGARAEQYEVYPLAINLDGNPNKQLIFLSSYAEIKVGGKMIVLSHYPIASWNEMKKNSWMIHGHEHGTERRSKAGETKMGKILDVSIENLLAIDSLPLSFAKLENIMNKKEYVAVGHH